jgi:hypothetical protein
VIADSGIPVHDGFHARPPSVETPTPPSNVSGSRRRHIFGRGRSCVPEKAPHMRPGTSGSKSTQYVVLRHWSGTPTVELVQLSPSSSLRNSPMSVYEMKTRFGSNGSQWMP